MLSLITVSFLLINSKNIIINSNKALLLKVNRVKKELCINKYNIGIKPYILTLVSFFSSALG